MQLSGRALNRTLLLRQHLLERSTTDAVAMIGHLIGLQAQDVLPPYLSLAARIEDFRPATLSDALEDRSVVRLFSMRGTIHVLTADDALPLRAWVQPMLDRAVGRTADGRAASVVPREVLVAEVARVLRDGPVPVKALGDALAARHPDIRSAVLGGAARAALPLVQVPPRGRWGRTGGVVYERAETWLGRPATALDVTELVRRYLRAFGPATAADVTTWSGVTGLSGLIRAVPDLVRHRGPDGKVLYDVDDAPIADADLPAPVRLLGKYDNLWLAHAGRDRVTSAADRRRWMGTNGGVGNTVFVDGMLTGLWRLAGGQVEIELFRSLTRAQRAELDEEAVRVRTLLTAEPA